MGEKLYGGGLGIKAPPRLTHKQVLEILEAEANEDARKWRRFVRKFEDGDFHYKSARVVLVALQDYIDGYDY